MGDAVCSFVAQFEALATHHRAAHEADRALKIIPRRCDLYTRAAMQKLPTTGDDLLQKLRGALAMFDKTNDFARSNHQRQFHDSMIAACVRHIFADEFDANFARILADNGWDQARQEVRVNSPSTGPMPRVETRRASLRAAGAAPSRPGRRARTPAL